MSNVVDFKPPEETQYRLAMLEIEQGIDKAKHDYEVYHRGWFDAKKIFEERAELYQERARIFQIYLVLSILYGIGATFL